MKPLADCRLYTFIDTAYLRGRPPNFVARELCEGGSDLIQLRAKNSTFDEIREMAKSILPITRSAGVGLVINDYPLIAEEVDAELCHLGQEDFFDGGSLHAWKLSTRTRQVALGLSTHSPEQAHRALSAFPSYIAIGPVYATATKPGAKPVTVEYVRWAAANITIPWFAIGGINFDNLQNVLDAGARRVCIVSAILKSDSIAATCRKFKEQICGE